METILITKAGSYFLFSSKTVQQIQIRNSSNKLISKVNISPSVPQKLDLSVGDKVLYPAEYVGFFEVLIDENGSGGSGGGGKVDSVNGKTGDVVLKSADITLTKSINSKNNVQDILVDLDSRDIGEGDFKSDGSVTMTGNLDFGNKKGINLSTPTLDTDASNKKYVDDSISSITPVDTSNFLLKDGSRQLDNTYVVKNDFDIATKKYVDGSISGIPPVDLSTAYLIDGSHTMKPTYSPSLDTDLITLKYFNDNLNGSGAVTSVNTLTGDVVLTASDVDAYNKTEVDDKFKKVLLKDGSVALTGTLDAGLHPIKNVGDPIDSSCAINLGYFNKNLPDPSKFMKIGQLVNENKWDNRVFEFQVGSNNLLSLYPDHIAIKTINNGTRSIKIDANKIQLTYGDKIQSYGLDRQYNSDASVALSDNTLLIKSDLERVELSNKYVPKLDYQLATKKYVDSKGSGNNYGNGELVGLISGVGRIPNGSHSMLNFQGRSSVIHKQNGLDKLLFETDLTLRESLPELDLSKLFYKFFIECNFPSTVTSLSGTIATTNGNQDFLPVTTDPLNSKLFQRQFIIFYKDTKRFYANIDHDMDQHSLRFGDGQNGLWYANTTEIVEFDYRISIYRYLLNN